MTRRDAPKKGAGRNGVNYYGATREGCVTGKWGWPADERRNAHSLAKALRRAGDHGIREYMCPHCNRWHVGHIPQATMVGEMAANEVYGR